MRSRTARPCSAVISSSSRPWRQSTSATLRLSALGVCEAWINGVPSRRTCSPPGGPATSGDCTTSNTTSPTSSSTSPPSASPSATAGTAAVWGGSKPQRYGDEIAAFAELRVRFADGHEQVIVTDDTWSAGPSAITANDFYDGQSIDARRRGRRVDSSRGSPIRHGAACTSSTTTSTSSRADPAPPVRRVAEIAPVDVWHSPSGAVLVDFGENIVGWLRVRVRGDAGHRDHRPARRGARGRRAGRPTAALGRRRPTGSPSAAATTLRADVHLPRVPVRRDRRAGPVRSTRSPRQRDRRGRSHSDLQRTGHFECSVPDLNQLHAQRRAGDARQLHRHSDRLSAARRAARLDRRHRRVRADRRVPVRRRRTSWPTGCSDLALEQTHRDGIVPYIVPDVLKYASTPQDGAGATEAAAFWSDAAVWVPWALWEAYGDPAVLAAHLPIDGRPRSTCPLAAVAVRRVGHRVPVRRLARPGRTRRRARATPRPTAASSRPRAPTARRTASARAARDPRPTARPRSSPIATRLRAAFHASTSRRTHPQRLHDRLRPRASFRAARCRRAASGRGRGWPSS